MSTGNEKRDGRWACGTCGTHYEDAGVCRPCDDEPLLDLEDGDVRTMLVEEDDKRQRARVQQLLFLSIPLGVALIVLLSIFVPGTSRLFGILPFGGGYLIFSALAGLLIGTALNKAMPAKRVFPDLEAGD